jgi:hypothetical protein
MRMLNRKIEIRIVEQSPLDVLLELWVRWQQRDDHGLGWRGRCAIIEGGSDECSDDEIDSTQLYDRMDDAAGKAVDVMICDLKVQHNWAIKKRCHIASAWRFPSLVFADVLAEAEDALIAKLKKNVATRNYFT